MARRGRDRGPAGLLVRSLALGLLAAWLLVLGWRSIGRPPDDLRVGTAQPAVAAGVAQRPRLMIVLIDGVAPQVASRLASLTALREVAAWGQARLPAPTRPASAWSTLLTGRPPSLHRVFGKPAGPIEVESIASLARRAGRSVAVVGVDGFVTLFGESADQVRFVAADAEAAGLKGPLAVANAAGEAWREGRDLVIAQFPTLDLAARAGVNPDYWRSVAELDQALVTLLGQIDLERANLILAGSFGLLRDGRRGGSEVSAARVPLVIAGPGAISGPRRDVLALGLAPTAAALLGLPGLGPGSGQPLWDWLRAPEAAAYRRDLAPRLGRLKASEARASAAFAALPDWLGRWTPEPTARRAALEASLSAVGSAEASNDWLRQLRRAERRADWLALGLRALRASPWLLGAATLGLLWRLRARSRRAKRRPAAAEGASGWVSAAAAAEVLVYLAFTRFRSLSYLDTRAGSPLGPVLAWAGWAGLIWALMAGLAGWRGARRTGRRSGAAREALGLGLRLGGWLVLVPVALVALWPLASGRVGLDGDPGPTLVPSWVASTATAILANAPALPAAVWLDLAWALGLAALIGLGAPLWLLAAQAGASLTPELRRSRGRGAQSPASSMSGRRRAPAGR